MRRQVAQVVLTVLALGASWSGLASAQQWDTLGNVRLKSGGWENTVEVLRSPVTAEIRIDVDGADIDMQDLRLQFENGTVWAPNFKLQFREGARSAIIKLPDASHRIRRVGFTYRSLGGGPLVSIWGRASQPPTEADWIHLGARAVGFDRNRDSIEVEGDDLVHELRFWADSNEVDLSKVTVTYSSGEVVALASPVPVALRRGRVVPLPGSGGIVRRIAFSYRSPFKETPAQSKSLIHVYGRP